MEKEYKWKADESLLDAALLWASDRADAQSRNIHMQSRYYDTKDGLLRNQMAALRLRKENEASVICMKLRNVNTPEGMRAHEEYECEAGDLADGLMQLVNKGAPRDLCEKAAAAPLEVTCEVNFTRCAVLIQDGDTVCELALDKGQLIRKERSAPLCEIELEFIAGNENIFHDIAKELSETLSLIPEPLSKLERARAL